MRFNEGIIGEGMNKSIHIKKITNIDSWWSYGFQGSQSAIPGSTGVSSQQNSNKIFVFTKISNRDTGKYLLLREQIYLSGKFPNDVRYDYKQEFDENFMLNVWNLDKCMERIQLDWIK